MDKFKIRQKGIVLIVVLLTVFIVILLANIFLGIMASQARLTHHKTSRIQAYYAAMAGVNYAYDKLRSGNDINWPMPAPGDSYEWELCRSGCIAPDINDLSLPSSIQDVKIKVSGTGVLLPDGSACTPPPGVPICISATTDYTYSP